MEFGNLRGLRYAGDGQPKSTGRQQRFILSWWPGTAQAEILAQVSTSGHLNQERRL